MEATKKGKTKLGTVISNKMVKSVVVEVSRTVIDPVFKKYVRKKSKFMAHDESDAIGVGDTVLIRECRPLSKRKRWKVEKVVSKATGIE